MILPKINMKPYRNTRMSRSFTARQPAYIQRLQDISMDMNYHNITMSDILKQQKELRRAMKWLNEQLAYLIKQKAIYFQLKDNKKPRPKQAKLHHSQIIEQQLSITQKKAINLKAQYSILQTRLQQVNNFTKGLQLDSQIRQVMFRINQVKQNILINSTNNKAVDHKLNNLARNQHKQLQETYAKFRIAFQKQKSISFRLEQCLTRLDRVNDQIQKADYQALQLEERLNSKKMLFNSMAKDSQMQQKTKQLYKKIQRLKKKRRQKALKGKYLQKQRDMQFINKTINSYQELAKRIDQQIIQQNQQIDQLTKFQQKYLKPKKHLSNNKHKGQLQLALQVDKRRNSNTHDKHYIKQPIPQRKQSNISMPSDQQILQKQEIIQKDVFSIDN